jgi:hypothetical protein
VWEERILARLDHRPLSDVARVGSLQPKFSFSGVVAVHVARGPLDVYIVCKFYVVGLCGVFLYGVFIFSEFVYEMLSLSI